MTEDQSLARRIIGVWKNYIVGQFLLTVFVFFMTWIAGALTGLHVPFLNALAAGVCESIPNFGPIISGAISCILALAFGSTRLDLANWQFFLVILACVIVIQLLQNLLINPLVIGKKMNLNPFLVFIGMTAFSIIFGFWGMILAVPIMGSIREIYRYYRPAQEKEEEEEEDPLQR